MGAESKFNNSYVFKAYELAKAGFSDKRIAEGMGITQVTLRSWRDKFPIMADAIEEGRTKRGLKGGETFIEYVYKQLPEELRAIWVEIERIEDEELGPGRIEELFRDKSMRVRQHLFIHAYVDSNFNASEACRRLNIPRPTFESWKREEAFNMLIDEINWHKQNFFEGALVGLVRQGDTTATIFANKTLNRDRGYNDKQEISVNHNHSHSHSIDIDALPLPIDIKKLILEAVREAEKAKAGEPSRVLEIAAVAKVDAKKSRIVMEDDPELEPAPAKTSPEEPTDMVRYLPRKVKEALDLEDD